MKHDPPLTLVITAFVPFRKEEKTVAVVPTGKLNETIADGEVDLIALFHFAILEINRLAPGLASVITGIIAAKLFSPHRDMICVFDCKGGVFVPLLQLCFQIGGEIGKLVGN